MVAVAGRLTFKIHDVTSMCRLLLFLLSEVPVLWLHYIALSSFAHVAPVACGPQRSWLRFVAACLEHVTFVLRSLVCADFQQNHS